MFTAEDFQSRLRQAPFTPTRIMTTTGDFYDIYHPDMVLVGTHFLVIGMPSSKNPTQADAVTRVAMFHVTEMRDLPAPAGASNGAKK